MKVKDTIANAGSYLNNLFVVDQETMKPSHSKVFAWVGFIVLTYAFIEMFTKDDSLFLVYGGLVFGNHISTRWTNRQRGASGQDDDSNNGNQPTDPK
jgi:hypothetical protein